MASKPTITVIGSLNIDFVTITSRVPGPGETLTAKALQVNAGGKGANQAVACGKASFSSKTTRDVAVQMVGSVGKDDPYYASLLRPTLEHSGVGMDGISEITDSQTGTATILVEENGENRILVVPGANYDSMGDANSVVSVTKSVAKSDVLVMQGEIPRSTTIALINSFGASSDTVLILNPAPVFPQGIPVEVLSKVDFLIVNESECLLLATHVESLSFKVEDEDKLTTAELQSVAASFHSVAGVKNMLITLGARGVFYSTQAGKQGSVTGIKVDSVVDTTAAGDTFVGYFAAALARHVGAHGSSDDFDIPTAARRANAAAAICVQRSGAMQSIPFGYEVS